MHGEDKIRKLILEEMKKKYPDGYWCIEDHGVMNGKKTLTVIDRNTHRPFAYVEQTGNMDMDLRHIYRLIKLAK